MKTIFENIDSHRKDMIELQSLLTSIPALAPESGGDGELKKCEALEKYLKKHGIKQLERFDAPDNRVKSGIRPNLVATIPGETDDEKLWIMTHMDVVPEGDLSLWQTIVESCGKDGKLFGRGVEDNQQGLAPFCRIKFIK